MFYISSLLWGVTALQNWKVKKKRLLVKCLTLKHNITRHSEIASTRELQVLFEVSGVVFLEVFTKFKDSYNFPSFKVWGKFVMTKFNSNHIFEEAIPESCLLSDFVFLKIYVGSSFLAASPYRTHEKDLIRRILALSSGGWLRRFSQMILCNYTTSFRQRNLRKLWSC